MFSKRLITLAAVAGTTLAATASLAGAQVIDLAPDGGPHDDAPPSVHTEVCGALTTDIVKTSNVPSTTNSMNFVQLPGAATVINVPGGQSRCVKVLFTAETACGPSAAVDYCYVEATIDGVQMDPQGNGVQALDSENATAGARAYEWVERVGPGNHLIQIQRRVGNAATSFYNDDWTFDAEVHL
jgi:hypothetical protein